MTQRLIFTHHQNKPVTIVMGWDRPMQSYFLMIELDSEESSFLYSNITDSQLAKKNNGNYFAPVRSLEYFQSILSDQFGLVIPEEFFKLVRDDKANDIGNGFTTYEIANGHLIDLTRCKRLIQDEITYRQQGTFTQSYLELNRDPSLKEYFQLHPEELEAHSATLNNMNVN